MQARSRTHTHARTHARTHTHTRTRARAHTHTHTHTARKQLSPVPVVDQRRPNLRRAAPPPHIDAERAAAATRERPPRRRAPHQQVVGVEKYVPGRREDRSQLWAALRLRAARLGRPAVQRICRRQIRMLEQLTLLAPNLLYCLFGGAASIPDRQYQKERELVTRKWRVGVLTPNTSARRLESQDDMVSCIVRLR